MIPTLQEAKDRGWLICDEDQTSPAVWSKANELNIELNIEPFKGFKVQLTTNRTDNRTNQIQFMYDEMPITRSGSYTKTHCAIATSLKGSSVDDGYNSEAFNTFLGNIPVIANRINSSYNGLTYPKNGFMKDNAHAGMPFDPEVGTVNSSSSDVLIPAFIAAYTGVDASKIYLDPFPSFAHVLPNWRVTYDGFINLWNMRK